MDSYHMVVPLVTQSVAVILMSAPLSAIWLTLRVPARVDPGNRAGVLDGLGYGLVAAAAGTMIGAGAERLFGMNEVQWLAIYAPVTEETLKALAILMTVWAMARPRERRLTSRRCILATVTVVAAFATAENLGHLAEALLDGRLDPGDIAAVADHLQVRAFLPPLAHLAETWPVGAALWLASRCRGIRGAAYLLPGWAAAVAIHAMWNNAALRWWPEPRPLLVLLMASFGLAAAGYVLASRRRAGRRPYDLSPSYAGRHRVGQTPTSHTPVHEQ